MGNNRGRTKDTFVRFRVDEESLSDFKEYCRRHNNTMSNVLLGCMHTIVEEEEQEMPNDPPPEEKNPVNKQPDRPTYRYCGCGLDLSTLESQEVLSHIQNCKSRQS